MAQSKSNLTPGEVSLLNCLHDARNDLSKLIERWDNCLAFKNLSLVENYMDGRLAIAINLERIGVAKYKCIVFRDMNRGRKFFHYSAAGSHCYGAETTESKDWNQESMLVGNIKIVESVERVIPSLIWLYHVNDQIDYVCTGDLYFSTVDSRFKFLPRIPHREASPLRWLLSGHGDDLASREIEGGSQVMNGVTDDQRNVATDGLEHPEFQDICAIRLVLDPQTISVRLDQCRDNSLKLRDVLYGPFNLEL